MRAGRTTVVGASPARLAGRPAGILNIIDRISVLTLRKMTAIAADKIDSAYLTLLAFITAHTLLISVLAVQLIIAVTLFSTRVLPTVIESTVSIAPRIGLRSVILVIPRSTIVLATLFHCGFQFIIVLTL